MKRTKMFFRYCLAVLLAGVGTLARADPVHGPIMPNPAMPPGSVLSTGATQNNPVMPVQTINSATVEVVVIGADGKPAAEAQLTSREVATVAAVDAALRATKRFQTAYPDATLVRVESMRGVDENRNGRYYLRYRYAGGATEFWGHVGRQFQIHFNQGIVGVVMPVGR